MAKSQKTEKVQLVTEKALYKSTAEINTAVEKAVKQGVSLQTAYQKIACSAIVHLGTHKDIRVIRNILDTLPEGLRKVAMATFFDRFAPVRFDDEGQVHYDDTKKVQLGLALETAWWKTAKEATYTPFVFEAEIQKLIDRASKKLEKGVDTSKGDSLSTEQINGLRALIAKPVKTRKSA
jgi:hypothetical protein